MIVINPEDKEGAILFLPSPMTHSLVLTQQKRQLKKLQRYDWYFTKYHKTVVMFNLLQVLSKVIDHQESIFSRDSKCSKIFSKILAVLSSSWKLNPYLSQFYNTAEFLWIIHLLVQSIGRNVLFMRKHCSIQERKCIIISKLFDSLT